MPDIVEDRPSAAAVLEHLVHQVKVATRSNLALAGSVEKAAAAEDRRRWKKHQRQLEEAKLEARKSIERPVGLRRKEGLRPFPSAELGSSIGLTYAEVLHHLARGLTLTQRGAARGLAEHWGSLKYIQALQAGKGPLLWLSPEGRRTVKYYKALQSDELGHAFALAAAARILRSRYPQHRVSIVHADTVLRAGWALTSTEKVKGSEVGSVGYRFRPQYLAEVWKPSEPSMVFPIACKGNHTGPGASHDQLASSAAYVDGLHIGPWNETPGFVLSTELPVDGPVTVNALHASGRGGNLTPTLQEHADEIDLNPVVEQKDLLPGIQHTKTADHSATPLPGCQLDPKRYAWFQRVLAHTSAAGMTSFAGAGRATSRLLTDRQGRKFFRGLEHPASGSVQDSGYQLLGTHFTGTDHIFRLNEARVEAFSGIRTDLFRLLAKGRRPDVESLRSRIYDQGAGWPATGWDPEWGGPVSIDEDGTVLALRVVEVKRAP
ncbi:hypothetical protein [Streptomyces sp. NBC_01089]|uniref:hypothetical protein n=1 Tax=Streptomyces sp. NBC_01089 TaxID=2903747 RepID=UPI00386E7672|nr:hypothetical protein OG510_08355 [Streptomyces sp. NBC_01089]